MNAEYEAATQQILMQNLIIMVGTKVKEAGFHQQIYIKHIHMIMVTKLTLKLKLCLAIYLKSHWWKLFQLQKH